STPNEVAIHAVAETLKAQGCTVTISGEGADELFGGYAGPMTTATLYQRQRINNPGAAHIHAGEFELENVSWVGRQLKPHIMSEHTWDRLEDDAFLRTLYRTQFERLQLEAGATDDAPIDNHLAAHLKFQRAINLAGLLQRLDTATMLASVEGRTPFADAHLATHAEQTPLSYRFQHEHVAAEIDPAMHDSTQEIAPVHTKAILRSAFQHRLPHTVLSRKKASFPLPFQTWAAPLVGVTQSSSFLREHCSEAALATINAEPTQAWNISWPLINLALWADRWWR
ncbi:MAG: asparagine synthase, partial [Okeania sp. SIO3C4]|nr:asparagine synthase [Okeania sp. SIO3C4]